MWTFFAITVVGGQTRYFDMHTQQVKMCILTVSTYLQRGVIMHLVKLQSRPIFKFYRKICNLNVDIK